MELIFMNHDGTEEITRCDISDDIFQRLEDQAQERGITMEEQILLSITTALEVEERHRKWDAAWKEATTAKGTLLDRDDDSSEVEEITAEVTVNQDDKDEVQRGPL